MPEPIIATWYLRLKVICPGCGEVVDLLDDPDFWDSHICEACEHNTPRTTDMEVVCPECKHEFKVNTEY
jgi:predicted RNA-binding Zn-ribbon protein involved in translation (DUF1610 family)